MHYLLIFTVYSFTQLFSLSVIRFHTTISYAIVRIISNLLFHLMIDVNGRKIIVFNAFVIGGIKLLKIEL